jgi:hypothetical protein
MLPSLKLLPIVVFSSLLGSCSGMPGGPSVLVLPGTGKDFAKFHDDDAACRLFVDAQIKTAQQQAYLPKDEAQQRYDIDYIQCMYGKGHRVPVPTGLMYDTRQEWHPPPPPNTPPPPQGTMPPPSANP